MMAPTIAFDGSVLIGGRAERRDTTFSSVNPQTGDAIATRFSESTVDDVDAACASAADAFAPYSNLALAERTAFLEAVADAILALGDPLIDQAIQETGLPRARLEGERGRTVGQLRLFAAVVRQGDWLRATIDPALPDRQPLPRSDLRRRHVPVGPVAVFGAANFPLAFSVAGGDTASALAAGCPVVVKGHPAHPGTGELVARAVQGAVAACGLHPGVFSFLPGTTNALGAALVADPRIQAVGFTGSRGGGIALARIATERPVPIPVYAEMSSINPVILFPEALKVKAAALGKAFIGSLTMGAGQFCTNPGLVLAIAGPDLETFMAAAVTALDESLPQTMLSPAIHASFEKGVAALGGRSSVTTLAHSGSKKGRFQACGALFAVDAQDFLADASLGEEVFGSSSIVVRCRDLDELAAIAAALEGQLTATLHIEDGDHDGARRLIGILEHKAGRILVNGWPTGVEVSHAMVHGGPFPATTDSRTTSVGSLAIERFLRPVCYQDVPDALLPAALRRSNPWKLSRRVEGVIVAGEEG
jgi:alpha-ketoglutaric semialdehyde dehydrogenase